MLPETADLQQRVVHAAQRAAGVDLRSHEESHPAALRVEVAPAVESIVEEAIQVLDDVLGLFEAEPAATQEAPGGR
jgi:hypothetical protein